jgi:hypothetical protein
MPAKAKVAKPIHTYVGNLEVSKFPQGILKKKDYKLN